MNKIFHYGIILFIIVGLIFNKQEAMLKALLQTPFDVFELCKTLILSICLWNGLLKIIQASNMMNHLNFLFKPLLRWIYGRCIQDEQIYQALSSNLIANLLGLGTLATMSGLQAIFKLKEKNYPLQIKILVVINTAGFSILPTTMMTIRQNYHSQNILAFYPYSLFIGFSITIIGIVIIKVIEHV